MASPFEELFFDPLYGEVHLEEAIANLSTRPLVQRLRYIRLSNIDSLASPGISNISRYEHALGTAVLAGNTLFAKHAEPKTRIAFTAAALIHDTGITPFGHLMEEALSYLKSDYHHENIWAELHQGRSSATPGGVNLQVYLGFQSGLREWAEKFFGVDGSAIIGELANSINGRGTFGPAIVGELDLDNLDNVSRAAYHIGLPVDRQLPLRIANCLENVNHSGMFFSEAIRGIANEWLALREQVYSRFMLPRADFSGKLMLLFAIVQALKIGALSEADRNFTDHQLLQLLTESPSADIKSATRRWLIADLWDISELVWFEGETPTLSKVNAFADEISATLCRPCFAYRIKDKRKRSVELNLVSGEVLRLGDKPTQWLLGIGSPIKRAFTARDNQTIVQMARTFFNADSTIHPEQSSSLFA